MGEGGDDRVAVIGAGIVGACCAAYLAREGRAVTLLDPGEPGMGASFGNGACIFPSSIVPMSQPGMIWNVPHYLFDPDGPLAIRMRYLPNLAPWLWRFRRAGTAPKVEAAARALRALLAGALDDYAPLLAEAGAQHLVRRSGHCVVYESEASFRADDAAMALRARNGVAIEDIGPERLRGLEPSLAPRYTHARLIAESGHSVDPLALVQALVTSVERRGGRVLRERATGFDFEGDRVVAVRTGQGRHACSHAVLAAGAWSGALAAQLGDAVPLETERGYHAMIADPECVPRMPTMSGEGKFIAIALRTGIRFAGQVELANLAAPPDWNRARILLRLGRRMYPGLGERDLESRTSMWLGFRPSLPDSLPVIGRAARCANAIHAFGHAHVGLCAGAATGRIVADLIAGREPATPIAAFSPRRFA